MLNGKNVLVKGGGDFATGAIRRLNLAGAKVIVTELPKPLNVRREVSFSEAVHRGEIKVEGVKAVLTDAKGIDAVLDRGHVAVIIDPKCKILKSWKFDIVVDGIMAKKNLGTSIKDAPVVIALGPGFSAGKDCHAVVETLAGHDLGRVIYKGPAAPNTGKPAPPEYYLLAEQGIIAPCSFGVGPEDLMLRAPANGRLKSRKKIGDMVKAGEVIGTLGGKKVVAKAKGVLRGLIHPSAQVKRGTKIGDIDPTCEKKRAFTISEKANAIGGGVLEACLFLLRSRCG